MSIFSDLLRDLKYGPIEAAKKRLTDIAEYGYPEEDTSASNPPPPPEPDFGQWDALAANEGTPLYEDYSTDEVPTEWDAAQGGFMGLEVPAVEPYPVEDTQSDFSIPDFGFGGFTGIDEPPSGMDFSERLRQWRELNRPGTDPWADVEIAGAPADGSNYVTPLAPPSRLFDGGGLTGDEFQQWDSLPTPGADPVLQDTRNPELERWEMAKDDASFPGDYSLNPDWSPPIVTEDFMGEPRIYDPNLEGQLAERANPVMGENGDSLDWTMDSIGKGLHVANVLQTAPKEVASDFFPTILDTLSGQAAGDAIGGGLKGDILERLIRLNPATGIAGAVSDLGEATGLYDPGTGYNDAKRPFTTARNSKNPWDFAEQLTEQNSDRPLWQQFAGELINPMNALGAGMIGDDAPRIVKAIDTAGDWVQGGPIFNAALSGAGRGAGALTEAVRRAPAAIDAFDQTIFGRLAKQGQSLEFGGGDFGSGAAFDPSSMNLDEMSWLNDAPRFPISNTVTPPATTPRGPLDIAATIKQPPELMAQGADDISLTLSPRFELPPADAANATVLENLRLWNAARGDIGAEDRLMRSGQFGNIGQVYDEALARTGSPSAALAEASKVSDGPRRTPYQTIPLTPEQADEFIVRAKSMLDQGGITTPQFAYDLPRAIGKLNEGTAPAPAEMELLRYIATGIKENDAGFKTPSIPDTDTLPMFGAGEDFSASIGKMDDPDNARRIIPTGEPQPNLFRMGSEEAGSPYRVEGDINPTGQSFVPPRIPANEAQIPLTLEYGTEGFIPGVTPNTTGITSGDLPNIPTNEQQLPAVVPYGADSFVPAVTPNNTGVTSADLPRIPTNEAQLEIVKPYGTESFMPMVSPAAVPFDVANPTGIERLAPVVDLGKERGLAASKAPGLNVTSVEDLQVVDSELKNLTDQWRAINYPVLDSTSLSKGTGTLSKFANGGDVPSRIANTLTLRGRELQQAILNSPMAKNGLITEEFAQDAAKNEIATYLNQRFAKALTEGDTPEMARQALVALNMGDFSDAAFRAPFEIDKTTGKVPGWMRTAEGISARVKNQKFGFLDINAIGANVLPGIQGGFPALATKMLNDMMLAVTKGKVGVDLSALPDPSLVGLNIRPKGMDVDPSAGTLVGGLGNILDSGGMKTAGSALRKVDAGLTKYNDLLTDVQYNKLLGGQRKAIYEGNLVIMKLLGKDISDATVQRSSAEMANALTSAANLATRNGRRAVENTSLTSASFLRAQGELLKLMSNIVTGGTTTKNAGVVGKAVTPERILAATTLVSMAGAAGGAAMLAGGAINLDPLDPKNFGEMKVPNGNGGYMTVQLFPQKQLARGIGESFQLMKDADPKELAKTWGEFFLGRAAPIPAAAGNIMNIGFDPKKENWAWGDWGDTMSFFEEALAVSQLPSGFERILDVARGEDSLASLFGQVSGLQSYDEGPVDAAIRDDISSGLLPEGATYADIKKDPVLNRAFNNRHPAVWEDDGELGTYQQIRQERSAITEGYEDGRLKTGDWRDNLNSKSDQSAGVFREMGISPKPSDDESPAQVRQREFNQTYNDAKDPDTGLIDFDKLDTLQTEFWDKYDTAADRKAIIAFQAEGASGPAEVLYIKDKARLRGFDPDTGKRLTFTNGKPLPDYYELKENNRYEYKVLNNQLVGDMMDRFDEWRGATGDTADKDVLLAKFINEVEKRAPDGKPWDATRLADVNNYGKPSHETLEFQAYKNTYKAWVSWDDQESYWSEIERLHKESNKSGAYVGPKKK